MSSYMLHFNLNIKSQLHDPNSSNLAGDVQYSLSLFNCFKQTHEYYYLSMFWVHQTVSVTNIIMKSFVKQDCARISQVFSAEWLVAL